MKSFRAASSRAPAKPQQWAPLSHVHLALLAIPRAGGAVFSSPAALCTSGLPAPMLPQTPSLLPPPQYAPLCCSYTKQQPPALLLPVPAPAPAVHTLVLLLGLAALEDLEGGVAADLLPRGATTHALGLNHRCPRPARERPPAGGPAAALLGAAPLVSGGHSSGGCPAAAHLLLGAGVLLGGAVHRGDGDGVGALELTRQVRPGGGQPLAVAAPGCGAAGAGQRQGGSGAAQPPLAASLARQATLSRS